MATDLVPLSVFCSWSSQLGSLTAAIAGPFALSGLQRTWGAGRMKDPRYLRFFTQQLAEVRAKARPPNAQRWFWHRPRARHTARTLLVPTGKVKASLSRFGDWLEKAFESRSKMTATLGERQHAATIKQEALHRALTYPRVRYMGSKYKLAAPLATTFQSIGGSTFLDAFSGSGFVGYLAKGLGYQVSSNDYLAFPSVLSRSSVMNNDIMLSDELIEKVTGPAVDDRDFIRSTFQDVFFTADDRAFLDSAWSHIATMTGPEKDLALSALILSAARKQPRGVFTISGDLSHYDDGRRDLSLSMRDHFRERAAEWNAAVFDGGLQGQAFTGDVKGLEKTDYDVVYMDPPYAPPSDDADYTKRYHFLEGLSDYWVGREIMQWTRTKKIPKQRSLFANKRTAEDALMETFEKFQNSGAIVLSYSSNALPGAKRLGEMLRTVKSSVKVTEIDHTYHFGTHKAAKRRAVQEYIFVGRD